MRVTAMALAVLMGAGALAEPVAPAGVRLSAPADLQKAIDGVKGDGQAERWARARLYEREAEVLAAGGLVGAAGEAAAKGLKECAADPWEVAVRLHLMMARFLDDLGPDRRDAYDDLRGKTAEAEVQAADDVAKKLGDGFAAKVLGREVEDARAYRRCRTELNADPDKLLAPIVDALRKLKTEAASAEDKAQASRALCIGLNDYADACRRKGVRLSDAEGKTAQAVTLLKAAVKLFGEALEAYAGVENPVDAGKATLLQNRALAMANLGEVLMYATAFDDPKFSEVEKRALLGPVREAVPPGDVEAMLGEALRLVGQGRKGSTLLHWELLQNLAQAVIYETMVTRPDDPGPGLVRAGRLAQRSADELEGLGLYLEALDAMFQEAKSLELGGHFVEAALVYLHGTELCERVVGGLAPSEGGEYRRTKDAMFGRLMQILKRLRDGSEPFPEELLGEWGTTWAEMEWAVADLSKARTFADLVQLGGVWRESKVPAIATYERLRRDVVKLEEKAAGGALDEAGLKQLTQTRRQWVAAGTELAGNADRGYIESMARTRGEASDVQEVLREGEVVVAYYLWHDHGIVEVLGKTGPPKVVDLALGDAGDEAAKLLGTEGRQDLEAVVGGLVGLTRDGLWPEKTGATSPEGSQPVVGKWPAALNLLYRILLEPIAKDVADAKTVIFVPQGTLHYLPFDALIASFPASGPPAENDAAVPVGTVYWGMEKIDRATAYLPTAETLCYLRTRDNAPASGVGVVARPKYPQYADGDTYQQAVERLAGFERFVEPMTRKPGPYVEAEATREKAQSVLEAPVKLAVMGCHGKANWRYPLASSLMLAPTAGHEKDEAMHDGEPLTLADTMTMKVSAPVVFLAACQTGQSTEVGGSRSSGNMGRMGDDLLSLSRGYMIGGASAIVTSLWECDPSVTVKFGEEFVTPWTKGKDLGTAVMKARRGAMEAHATPTWWAGFELQGDPAVMYEDR